MPTQEKLRNEVFLWSVVYPEGERLNEWDSCEHELEGKPEDSGHVFACIDKQRAIGMALHASSSDDPVHYVRCEGEDLEPIFFRRRTVDAPWNHHVRTYLETQEGSETWLGVRKMKDGETIAQVFLRVLPDGTSELRLDSDRN